MCPPRGEVMFWSVLLLLLPLTTGFLLSGPCTLIPGQSTEEAKDSIRSVLSLNISLVPVLMTPQETVTYSVAFSSPKQQERAFFFGISYGKGRCVDGFRLGIFGEDKNPVEQFRVTDTSLQGIAHLHYNATEGDWLMFVCQQVGSKGHVAQFYIFQRKDKVSRKTMNKEKLVLKYGGLMQELGLEPEKLLSFAKGDYKFCDEALQEQLSGYGSTLFWFRTVVLALIAIMLIFTIAGFAIRFFNAMTKLNKVRSFSAT